MISGFCQSGGSHGTFQHEGNRISMARTRSMSVITPPPNRSLWETFARKSPRSDTVLVALQKKDELMSFISECALEQLKQLFEIGALKDLPVMHLVVKDPLSSRREPKVAYLIEKKCDSNQVCEVGIGKWVAPLHLAVESHHVLTMMALLDKGGADINAVGKYRRKSYRFRGKWLKKTPLDIAEASIGDFLRKKGGKTYRQLCKSQ